MNEMHARLGAAIDDDRARFSGTEFADARLGSVLGSVKRRRAVRAAGVSSVSLVGASALAVGAANAPWGSLGTSLAPAGQSVVVCTTATPDPIAADAPTEGVSTIVIKAYEDPGSASDEVVSWSLWFEGDIEGKAQLTDDGLVVEFVGGPVQTLQPDVDGNYSTTLPDGSELTLSTDDGGLSANVVGVDAIAPSSSPSVDCVTATPEPSEAASEAPSTSSSVAPTAAVSPEPTITVTAEPGQTATPAPTSGANEVAVPEPAED